MKAASRTETFNIKGHWHLLQDAALIIAVLSAVGYFLAFSFERGYRNYYGIEAVSVTSIDIISIINTIYKMLPIIAVIGVIYLSVRLLIWLVIPLNEKMVAYNEMISNSLIERLPTRFGISKVLKWTTIFLNNFVVSRSESIALYVPIAAALLIPLYILGDNNSLFALIIGLTLLLVWLFAPLVIMLRNTIKNIDEASPNRNLNNPMIFIWITSNRNTKIVLIVLFSIGLGYLFYQYGYTDAEQQEVYFTIEDTSETLIILDKNDSFILVSPVNLNNPILKDEFQLISLQNNSNMPLNIKKTTITDGLQVIENPRTKQINKFFDYLNNSIISNYINIFNH